MSDAQRKYATANHPSIEALVHGLYRYKDRKQALARLHQIRDHFVLSKEQPESSGDDPAILLWIKGFALTEGELEKGYTGHFAEVRIGTVKDVFTLLAAKVDRPLTTHPQKKRMTSKHPNWGHPVMRAVKKAKRYASLEAANAELELLHTEFPEVSIPGQGKLYIIIYEKRPGIPRPTHKIALEIKVVESGYVITARDNEKAPKRSLQQPQTGATEANDNDAPGKFAASEALRKLKRRRRPSASPATVDAPGKFVAAAQARKNKGKR